MKFLLLLTFFSFPFYARSQLHKSTASFALGGIQQQTYNLSSVSYNPALIQPANKLSAEAQLSNLYGITDYSFLQLGFAFKTKESCLSSTLALSSFLYSPAVIGLHFNKKVAAHWHLGVGISYHAQINEDLIGYSVGIKCSLNTNTLLYAFIRNQHLALNRAQYSNPTQSAICIQHSHSEQITSYIEFAASAELMDCRIGISYSFKTSKIMLGMAFRSAEIGCGLIHNMGKGRIIMALSYHPYLSLSPSLSYGSKI